jgi:hypothetical protein
MNRIASPRARSLPARIGRATRMQTMFLVIVTPPLAPDTLVGVP